MSGHPLDLLPLLVSGELPATEAASVELHLAGCASCRAAFDALELIGRLPRSEATFEDLLLRRARREECDARSEALTLHAFDADLEMERHLLGCAGCAETLAGIRSLRAALDALPPSRATFDGLRTRLRPSRFRRILTGAAAAALLVVLATAGLLPSGQPAPVAVAPSPVAALLGRIESGDDATLRAAARTLDRQNVLHALQLAEAMDDASDSFRRYVAIRILRHLETPAAEDLLVRGLGKNGSRDRILVRALVELQSPLVVPWLLTRLEDPASRATVLNDLAQVRDRSTIAPLADFLADSRVAELLARFEAADLIQASDRHRNAALFVRIPSPRLQAHLVDRAAKNDAFREQVAEAAAEGGVPAAEFLVKAAGNARLEEWATKALDMMSQAVVERAVERALDRDDAAAAVRVVDALGLESMLPKLRRGVFAGRYPLEATLAALARLGDRETLIFIAKLRTHDRWGKAAAAALELADPMLRSEALAAVAPAEDKMIRIPSPLKPGRFRREIP